MTERNDSSGAKWSEGERSEPERNGAPDESQKSGGGNVIPDPEVIESPPRRRFSTEYKERIVREAEDCKKTGQIGALLRREGLYSSQLSTWRKKYRRGSRKALKDKKRGPKSTKDPLQVEYEILRKENERLKKRLKQAESIIEIQKKVSAILGSDFQKEIESKEK